MANLSVAWTDRDDQVIVDEASGHGAGAIHVGGPGDTLCLGDHSISTMRLLKV